MTADEVDETLAALARAATELLQECEAAQQRMEEWNDRSEAEIRERAGRPGLCFRPERALLSIRDHLATDSAKKYRDVTREFLSWWADVAMVAWKSAVLGSPIVRARVDGAAPFTVMTEEELALLPFVDDYTWQLAELSTSMGVPNPWGPGGPDGEPEARRRRLWGVFWIEHQIPALPDPEEWDLLVARTPDHVAERLRATAGALIRATSAGQRISELEGIEAPWNSEQMDEYERLSDELSTVPTRLADFAQAITVSLPEVRAACGGQGGDRG
ncbi:hypothetical protein [Streptomyces sp. G45]|uniref:hypothetical protein n=1 Tax=Streptomyces sp. G45 TaxID=3406627 RepID=UPI003C20DF47